MSSEMSGACSGCSSAPWASCCSSPAPTSPTCSWFEPKPGSRNWRFTPRSARARAESRGNCSRRASRSRSPAASWASGSHTRASAHWSPTHPTGCRAQRKSASTRWSLLFTLGISVLAGLLFGLLPVMKFATPHLASALKEGGRASSAGRDRHRARNGLVVAEIALAVVLLVASGLMIRTFQAMRRRQPWIRASGRGHHAARVDPRIDRRRRRAGDPNARADRAQARADPRRAIRRRVEFDHDGRKRQQRSDLRRGLPAGRPTRFRRCAVSSGRPRTTSRRWATRSSPGAR